MAIKTYRMAGRAVSLFLLIMLFSATVQARMIYVDCDALGVNDGSSWIDAYNYLQDALTDANSALKPVEIRIAEGIYTPDSNLVDPNGSGDRTSTFQLINGVTLKGGYAGFGELEPNAWDVDIYKTILSGDLDGNDIDVNDLWDLWNEPSRAENSYHIVSAIGTDETAILDGFTIASGNAYGIYNIHENLGGGMYTDSGGATVINCTFSGNSARYNGGGMYNSLSVLRLINCTFRMNAAKDSGGMEGRTSVLTLSNCTFMGNKALLGAGGMSIYDSDATLTNCAFSDNKAGVMGGGLHSINSNVTLTNCVLTGNASLPTGMGGGIGGGLGISDGNAIVTECIFSDNSAGTGGGMFGYGRLTLNNCIFSGNSAVFFGGGMDNGSRTVPAKITNCIFSGNSAGSGGGGIRNCEYGGSAMLTNCTFCGNSSGYEGGGIHNEYRSSATLINCILWDNTALWGSQVGMRKKESVMEVYYSCIEGGKTGVYDPYDGLVWSTGNIDADPCFADSGYWDPNGTHEDANDDFWVDGDYHLLRDSFCINAGDPNYIVEQNATDLDGRPRIINGRIDMGAYEYSPPIQAHVRIVQRTISLGSKGKWIAAFLRLSEDYNVADIDSNSIFLENEIEPERFWLFENNQVALIKFDREEVQNIISVGEIELTITGRFTDGMSFEASDVIKVVDKGGKK